MSTIKIGIVGFGKIARDEHAPAIASHEALELVAVADPVVQAAQVPVHASIEAMLAAHPELDAVALCQPPGARADAARTALMAGKHVFLEKPPGVSVNDVADLKALADERGLTLFAGWHSRYSPQVESLRTRLAGVRVERVAIDWLEDVRQWHPGQAWIWADGGFGVLDPGINALSILTAVLDGGASLHGAVLEIPANHAMPIAARMALETAAGAPVDVAFDWRQTGPQVWRIVFETSDGPIAFQQGGDDAASAAPGEESSLAPEYRAMYRRFADLVARGTSEFDLAPLQIVSDAWAKGRVETVAPFYE